MPTFSQEKRPGEKINLSADFSSSLLPGESLISGNVTVTATNVKTETDATSTIISTTSVLGNLVTATVMAGADGDIYRITFYSGATDFALLYETEIHLIITGSPAAETPLTTRDLIKEQLKITDSSDDSLIDNLNLFASQYIRTRTGRDFTLTKYTQTIQPLHGEDHVRLQLYHYPVIKIFSVLITDENDNQEVSISDDTYWDFLPEGYIWLVKDPFVFDVWPNKNIITYLAGYPRIPEDLKQACQNLCVSFYRAIGREGLSQETIGDYTYKIRDIREFPAYLRRELDERFVEGVISRYMRHDLHTIE